MQRIYSHPNPAMVHHAKNVLENHGIESLVQGDHLMTASGGVAPIDAWTELWVVDEEMVQEAARIVQDAVSESEDDDLDTWTCPSCWEEIEGQFAACWNCGTARPE